MCSPTHRGSKVLHPLDLHILRPRVPMRIYECAVCYIDILAVETQLIRLRKLDALLA